MYRSRNRPKRGGENEVKGPNSALTQFLREEGISAENIKQKWYQRQSKKGGDEKVEKSENEQGTQDDNSTTQGLQKETEEEVDDLELGSGSETGKAELSYNARRI